MEWSQIIKIKKLLRALTELLKTFAERREKFISLLNNLESYVKCQKYSRLQQWQLSILHCSEEWNETIANTGRDTTVPEYTWKNAEHKRFINLNMEKILIDPSWY